MHEPHQPRLKTKERKLCDPARGQLPLISGTNLDLLSWRSGADSDLLSRHGKGLKREQLFRLEVRLKVRLEVGLGAVI